MQNSRNLKTINSDTEGEFDLTSLNIGHIGFKSFENCYQLKTLKIGKYININEQEAQLTLGDGFVLGSSNLTSIYFESVIAPKINYGSYVNTLAGNFADIAENFVIYVPTNCKTTYINAWKAQIDADANLSSAQKTSQKAEIDALASHIQEYSV